METFKDYTEKTGEIGYITALAYSIVWVSGLPTLKLGEMIITEHGEIGIVHGLNKKTAEVLMFSTKNLKIGERIAKTNKAFQIPVSQKLLGRIINPLCLPIDGSGPVTGEKKYLNIQREAPGITQRVRVNKPLETGVMIVDLLIPIGYGQRELVIGDAKTGKTAFLLQTITSQAKKGVICVYVAIGKEVAAIKLVEDYLKEMNVFDKTIMVVSTPEDPNTVNYLAPFSGMTIAEYFRDQGKKVLVIFDDLTTHAKFYREISLLLKRIPGRASYPGDIFHIHAALLERAGNIKFSDNEEVSITAFPVAETLENDISGFIQTNLMAITDGHIFFDIEDFRKGKRPAINAFLSVSRVGNQTKEPLEKELANWIRKKTAEYKRVMEVAQFGVELSPETQKLLDLGKKLEIVFSQGLKTIIPQTLQLLLFGLLLSGFWENKPQEVMKVEIKEILKNHQKGTLFEIEKEIKKFKNLKELKDFVEKNTPKIKKIL
ncbi:F0F1 ATP synthase subunit alpha [bacterium]|nr:F0F1 ATP synthase subunit alpha [bacterium]